MTPTHHNIPVNNLCVRSLNLPSMGLFKNWLREQIKIPMFTQRNKHCPRQWQSGVMASAALENHWLGQFNCLCQGFSNEENKTIVVCSNATYQSYIWQEMKTQEIAGDSSSQTLRLPIKDFILRGFNFDQVKVPSLVWGMMWYDSYTFIYFINWAERKVIFILICCHLRVCTKTKCTTF